MATREQVMTALLARLAKAGDFKTVGRRNRNPEGFTPIETPALLLVEASENYRSTQPRTPSVRRLYPKAIVYLDVGTDETAVPATTINNILDAIDGLLKPDQPMTGQCTLGGLVESVRIEGTVVKAPGDVTGKSLAVVPINILLP